MTPISQHRALPRPRLIGEQGWLWIRDAAAGIGLVLFMIAAFALTDAAVHLTSDAARHAPIATAQGH